MKKKTSIVISILTYLIIILISCYFIIIPNSKKINETNKIKDLTYDDKIKLIDEINEKYIKQENNINNKYQVKLEQIDEKYQKSYEELNSKYKELENDINKKIIDINVESNQEFMTNGLSKKYYELRDEWSSLHSEKSNLTSSKYKEESEINNKKREEKNTITNNKESEIKKLNDKKTNEINRIDNINTNKKQIIKKCIINIIVGIIIILLPIIYVILKFNKLTKLLNNVKESWSSVDILLKQRADLIPNILAVVKGYSKHEKDTLTKITEARKEVLSAENKKDSINANEKLSNEIPKILLLKEEYPELKANKNFMKLQNNLSEVENNIAISRSIYNKNVLDYKNNLEVFPSNIIASIFNFKPELFFEIDKEERENPTIKLFIKASTIVIGNPIIDIPSNQINST